MEIYNYIEVWDFVEYVKENFDVGDRDIHRELYEDDYIEGSLGSVVSYGSSYEGMNQEIQSWFDKFFEEFDLVKIRLKYGSA